MVVYLVERSVPGMTPEQLAIRQQAVLRVLPQFAARGKRVRYLHTTFVPAEAHCLCLFQASNAKAVQEVNEAAQFPFTRIVEALELGPEFQGM
jgi:hypothetical protein